MNTKTFFSLVEASGHSLGNEYVTGLFWTCPFIVILLFMPNFLKNIYSKDKKLFVFISVIICSILINFVVTSFFGIIQRYIFEYSFLIIILSIVIFLFYIYGAEDRTLKYFIHIIFILIFICSIFINISLLFCKENFSNSDSLRATCYTKVVKFLF